MIFALLLFISACAVVNCDKSSNYYVVQMPSQDAPITKNKPFNVYWNVPTIQCKSKRIPFTDLYKNYRIVQNENDSFRGEKISILYDPGIFPALLKNESSGKFKFRNGGVPQEGDLERHLEAFRHVLDTSIPNPEFNGVGIIDFESWRPVYRQNFGVLAPYKDVSYEIERSRHWWWSKASVLAEATRRFEEAAMIFMQSSLQVAKEMRPHALWGYYAYPYCFNMAGTQMSQHCATNVPEENDRIRWLWSESTALYPSLYSSKDLSSDQLHKLIRGRVKEASRLARNKAPILPYFWFKYREGDFMSEKDLKVSLDTLYRSNASGLIIWGSSNDVNTKDKCLDLLDYVNSVLGPAVARYTKKTNIAHDDLLIDSAFINSTNELTNSKTNITITEPDPEFHWVPPENYTQDIISYVKNEYGTKNVSGNRTNTKNVNNDTHIDIMKESSMIDLIVRFLFKENPEKLDDDATENIINTTAIVNNPFIIVNESQLMDKNNEKGQVNIVRTDNYEYMTTTEICDNCTESLVDNNTEEYTTIVANNNYENYAITEKVHAKTNKKVGFVQYREQYSTLNTSHNNENSTSRITSEIAQSKNRKKGIVTLNKYITTPEVTTENLQSKNFKKGYSINHLFINNEIPTLPSTILPSEESSTIPTKKSDYLTTENENVISKESIPELIINDNSINATKDIKIRHSKNKRKGPAVKKTNDELENDFSSVETVTTEMSITTSIDEINVTTMDSNEFNYGYFRKERKHGFSSISEEINNYAKDTNYSTTETPMQTDMSTFQIMDVGKNKRKGTSVNKFDNSPSNSDVLEFETYMGLTSKTNQVADSSAAKTTDYNNHKFLICVMYFYSIGTCLCHVYGHCD